MTFPGAVRRKWTNTVTFDGNGKGSVSFVNGESFRYVVEQVSMYSIPRQGGVTAELYEGQQLVGTAYFAGTGDTFWGPPWLYLDHGEFIQLNWTNGPIGGQGVMSVWYSIEGVF